MYSIEVTVPAARRYATIDIRKGYTLDSAVDAFEDCVDYYGNGEYAGGRVAMIDSDGYIVEQRRI